MRMDDRSLRVLPPILRDKHYSTPSAFTPESLLREARRQKDVPDTPVPDICILDPDGDIVRHLRAEDRARPVATWACYHSTMDRFDDGGREYGIVGCAVGAPYAVLVAEQLFASGCRLLLSITSSGQVTTLGPPPYFILIERALRDEGTSYHYLPAGSEYAEADPALLSVVEGALATIGDLVERGATWTTDAPYRETPEAIAAARAEGILAVEMEAAALYAFAEARRKPVLCFAHVTNQMGQVGDFNKGEANGATASLALVRAVAEAYLGMQTCPSPIQRAPVGSATEPGTAR
jgi:uridine phosphorylase